MGQPAAANMKTTVVLEYDFAVHGGVKDANITLGLLPLNFVVTHCDVIAVTPPVGSTATLDVGHSTTPSLFFNDEAITTFDTAGKRKGVANETLAAATTTALRTIVLLINTANLTAGRLRVLLEGYVADLSTDTKPDTSY